MSSPRAGSTATLLRTGKVLVTGGVNRQAQHGLATTELYDPQSNTWTSGAPMSEPRAGQTATLLHDGDVLIAGGSTNSHAELYDPEQNSWKPAGTMVYPCQGGAATLVQNDDVLISGCAGERDAGDQLYNVSTNRWTATGTPPAALQGAGTALLSSGEVLFVGGYSIDRHGHSTSSPSAAVEVYAPATNTWRSLPPMSFGRFDPTVAALSDGDVLVAGGYVFPSRSPADQSGGYFHFDFKRATSAELYDPSTNRWRPTGNMPVGLVLPASVSLADGKVLVVGGDGAVYHGGIATGVPAASAEVYSPSSGNWSVVPDMPTGRFDAAAVLLQSGKVLVAGGIGSPAYGTDLSSAEIYGR